MKTILYIFNAFLLSGFISNLKAQEVENPQEELIGKDWYLTKLVIDEEEKLFIPSEEVNQSVFFVGDYYSDSYVVYSEVLYCEYGSSEILFNEENNNEFYFGVFIYLATDDNWLCITNEDLGFHLLLFNEFWNNQDLILNYDTYYPFHFTYSIQQHENHQSLIVINDAGYEAHYQSVPYMSVDQNEFSNLNIYPNPVKESFQIENLFEKSNLKIYGLSGKEIFEQKIHSSTESIDVSQLSSGLYFYGIFQDGSRVKTGKLVKE